MDDYGEKSQSESPTDELLEWAVNRVAWANASVDKAEQGQEKSQGDAKNAKKLGDKVHRGLKMRMARADLHDAGVILKAGKEIQRAAREELGKIQREYFVEELVAGDPDLNGQVVVRAVLKEEIPAGYRLHWTVGEYDPIPDPPQGVTARIDTRKLPNADVTVRAILEKGDDYPAIQQAS